VSLIYDMVRASEAAYDKAFCATKEFKYQDETIRIIQLHEDLEEKPRGYIRISPRFTQIAIAGTQDWEDAFKDALAAHEPFLNGTGVHCGFKEEFDVIWPTIKQAVLPGTTVYVTGHSLGGAIAQLVAVALKIKVFINPLVTTFGCPFTGDPQWAALYDRLIPGNTRVVHGWDIVPRWPRGPRWAQTDGLLHISSAGRVIGPTEGWFRTLCRWRKIVVEDLKGVSLKDHHILEYDGAVSAYDKRIVA
jgi:triacylglycerol lipase